MDDGPKKCPVCSAALSAGYREGLTTWSCGSGHGVGLNILEAYGHLQRDELEAMWSGAKDAPLSALLSPITGKPMAEITFVADHDTDLGNEGRGAQKITIELDVDTFFAWFEPHELTAMPLDRSKRGPAGVGLVGVDDLRSGGGHQYDAFGDSDDLWEPDDEAQHRLTGFLGGLARKLGV